MWHEESESVCAVIAELSSPLPFDFRSWQSHVTTVPGMIVTNIKNCVTYSRLHARQCWEWTTKEGNEVFAIRESLLATDAAVPVGT